MKCQTPSLLFSVLQPSVQMRECIHPSGGTSLAGFFFLPIFYSSYSVYPGVNEIGLIYLLSVSYQWTFAITKWTEVTQKPTHSVIKYVAAMQLCSASHWMQIMHDQWLTQEILDYNWLMCKPRKENKRRRYMRINIISVIKTKPGVTGTLSWHVFLTPV